MADPIVQLDKSLTERAVPAELKALAHYLNREIAPAFKQIVDRVRKVLAQLSDGSLNVGGITVTVAAGAPATTMASASPMNGWVYVRTDGGAGTTLYVFEGGAWAAK